MLVMARALVASYPTWTDEHGTNVEQLAAIASAALSEHGLLVEPRCVTDPRGISTETGGMARTLE